MKFRKENVFLLLFAVLTLVFAVWGPEVFAGYRDRAVFNEIHVREEDGGKEGYRYALGRGEKLYILAQSLNSQVLPETEQYAAVRQQTGESAYGERTGSYAFIVNHRGPSDREIKPEEVCRAANEGLQTLKELGILPDSVRETTDADYDAALYSAIDVLEPRNNAAVWKLSLSAVQESGGRENRLIDAYLDADDGKLYEFYVRTELTWEEMDPDAVVKAWSGYLGLGDPQPYEEDNPLLETTPYFKKYVFPGMGKGRTVVTVGYYDGIRELFLKISK